MLICSVPWRACCFFLCKHVEGQRGVLSLPAGFPHGHVEGRGVPEQSHTAKRNYRKAKKVFDEVVLTELWFIVRKIWVSNYCLLTLSICFFSHSQVWEPIIFVPSSLSVVFQWLGRQAVFSTQLITIVLSLPVSVCVSLSPSPNLLSDHYHYCTHYDSSSWQEESWSPFKLSTGGRHTHTCQCSLIGPNYSPGL